MPAVVSGANSNSQMLNVADIARDAGINQIQAKNWLGILEKLGTELIKAFELLDKSSATRSKGAVICMKPGFGAIDRDNYIVPVWMI